MKATKNKIRDEVECGAAAIKKCAENYRPPVLAAIKRRVTKLTSVKILMWNSGKKAEKIAH